MVSSRSLPKRIDIELDDVISTFAKKNGMSFRQASREIAKISKVKMNGKKIFREIRF